MFIIVLTVSPTLMSALYIYYYTWCHFCTFLAWWRWSQHHRNVAIKFVNYLSSACPNIELVYKVLWLKVPSLVHSHAYNLAVSCLKFTAWLVLSFSFMVLFIASLSLVYFLRSVLTYPILTLNSNECRQRGGDELTNLWTLYLLGPVERRVNSPGQLKEIHGHS